MAVQCRQLKKKQVVIIFINLPSQLDSFVCLNLSPFYDGRTCVEKTFVFISKTTFVSTT